VVSLSPRGLVVSPPALDPVLQVPRPGGVSWMGSPRFFQVPKRLCVEPFCLAAVERREAAAASWRSMVTTPGIAPRHATLPGKGCTDRAEERLQRWLDRLDPYEFPREIERRRDICSRKAGWLKRLRPKVWGLWRPKPTRTAEEPLSQSGADDEPDDEPAADSFVPTIAEAALLSTPKALRRHDAAAPMLEFCRRQWLRAAIAPPDSSGTAPGSNRRNRSSAPASTPRPWRSRPTTAANRRSARAAVVGSRPGRRGTPTTPPATRRCSDCAAGGSFSKGVGG
jgi:hypothetical protein